MRFTIAVTAFLLLMPSLGSSQSEIRRSLYSQILIDATDRAVGLANPRSYDGGLLVDNELGSLVQGADPSNISTVLRMQEVAAQRHEKLRGKPIEASSRDNALRCDARKACRVLGDAAFLDILDLQRTRDGVTVQFRIEFTDERPSGEIGIGFAEMEFVYERSSSGWTLVETRRLRGS